MGVRGCGFICCDSGRDEVSLCDSRVSCGFLFHTVCSFSCVDNPFGNICKIFRTFHTMRNANLVRDVELLSESGAAHCGGWAEKS